MKRDTVFDSRFLTFLDGYAIRFTVPGKFKFGMGIGTPANYNIIVTDSKDKTKKGLTNSITIKKNPSSKRGFIVKPEQIEIPSGDLILWHFTDNIDSIAISCIGNDKKDVNISNQKLTKGTVFTHCFIRHGQFSYRNGLSKNEARVNVKPIRGMSREEWVKKIQKPILVRVTEKKIDPPLVNILEGQTVVWIIESDAILQGEVINKPKTKKITIKPKTSEILKTIPRDIEKISQRQTQIILSKLNQKYSEKELADLIEIPDKKDIGVKLASKILTKQKKLGGFKNLSEVYEIEGIGPKRFADIIVSLSQKQT